MTRVFVFSLLQSLLSTVLCAQEQPAETFSPVTLPNTEIRLLHSNQAGVDYKLYISLPQNYRTDSLSYPVVFMLDADYSFAIARNICEHIAERNQMPGLLLVAIAYDGPPNYRVNRTRDYTPTYSPERGYGPEYQKHSGGGEKFRSFIREELLPFIASHYRVTQERTFVGHSYGGLFGAWVLFTTPELFKNYVLVSPSLWYDKHLMFGVEKTFAEQHTELPVKLYLTVGSREFSSQGSMITDLQNFAAQITSHNYTGLEMRTHVFDDETHNSVFPLGFSKGIRFMYERLP